MENILLLLFDQTMWLLTVLPLTYSTHSIHLLITESCTFQCQVLWASMKTLTYTAPWCCMPEKKHEQCEMWRPCRTRAGRSKDLGNKEGALNLSKFIIIWIHLSIDYIFNSWIKGLSYVLNKWYDIIIRVEKKTHILEFIVIIENRTIWNWNIFKECIAMSANINTPCTTDAEVKSLCPLAF